jgi:hypothetical protein
MENSRSDEMQSALELWKRVTGVDPGTGGTRPLGDWRMVQTFEALQEAIELDPSEITATLLLSRFLNLYVSGTEVSLKKVLERDQALAGRLEACRELYALIERPDIVAVRDAFVGAIGSALSHYKAADREDVKELLAAPDRIAVLRRDALRSISRLKVDQFLSGEPSPPSVKPAYAEAVHQWFNVNSLLAASAHMPPGIALNLIRTPSAYECYFAFSIRNGANLYVLSDVPEWSHPLQGMMSRRPDRELDERSSRNWFPYDLLGIEYTDEGELYFKEAQGTALAPYQRHAVPIKNVSELSANELVWLIMMFDLIKERFWRAGYQAKELSYTAEMLKSDQALLNAAKTANLPVAQYRTVGLPPLEIKDIMTSALTEDAVGEPGHRLNSWMEKRYADRINPATINLVAPPEATFRLENDGKITSGFSRGGRDMSDPFGRDTRVKLEKVGSSSFGTRKQLSDDRIFVARYNFAGMVNRLAHDEFENRKKEIADWYSKAVRENVNAILAIAAHQEAWVCDAVASSFQKWHRNAGPCRGVKESASGHYHMFRSLVAHHEIKKEPHIGAGMFLPEYTGWERQRCYFLDVKASYYVMLHPGNARELALFAGCKVEELPDVLQHFSLYEPYRGNHILDRIDPMEWHASNPWIDHDFRIRLAFSKRGMAELARRRKPSIGEGILQTLPTGEEVIKVVRLQR